MGISETWKGRLPAWVLAAAFLGLAAGIMFGERMAVFQPVGTAYTMMLESVVYPYLFSSLIGGLGGLTRSRAWRLFQSSWGVYLFLWAISFAMIFALGAAIPAASPPVVVEAGAQPQGISLVALLIPANIIEALSRNYVPAVVLFAVAFGVSVQTVRQKGALLDVIEVVRRGSLQIWGWVVYFAPVGVFALFASTAGTIAPEAAGRLTVYLCLFLIGAFTLAFIVLPLVLSAVAPANARELLVELRPALTLAVVTTLSVSALPFIQSAAMRILEKAGVAGEEAGDVVEAQVTLSYVFAQIGNYFIALFILYASYHFRVPLTLYESVQLGPMALLSGLGSPSATIEGVNFLGSWLGMPASTQWLYTESMTVTRYGQVVVSVVGFAVAVIAVPLIYFRKVQWRPGRLVAGLGAGAAIALVVVVAARSVEHRLFPPPSNAAMLARTIDPALASGLDVTVIKPDSAPLAPIDGPATVEGIRARGVLRVGYADNVPPFDYLNVDGDLVGFDISYAYRLARDLHVRLELVPLEWEHVSEQLTAHQFDIVMAGAYATGDRLRQLVVTEPYFASPIGMIVHSENVDRYLHYDEIAARDDLTLAVFPDPVLSPLIQHLFPKAKIVNVPAYRDLLDNPDIDAAIWSLDQARTWATAHRDYAAVKPQGMGSPFVFVYLLPPDSQSVAEFLNVWMDLKRNDGFRHDQLAYWMEGKPRIHGQPRWNLLDAILARWKSQPASH